MEQIKKHKEWWIVGGSIVVIVVVLVVLLRKPSEKVVVPEDVPAVAEEIIVTEKPVRKSATFVNKKVSEVKVLSYEQALVEYKDKRIQLDTNCQAYPNAVTYKENTGIMIDNRSAQVHTVAVDQIYTINPYDFAVVMLPNIATSKAIFIDCDILQNVATILVQK